MIKILELFGGIGACSKALERLNIEHEIVDYVEIDKYAVKSYNAIHNSNFEPQDITQWDKDIEVDLIMHGSPCQDFSLTGKQAGGDEGTGTRSSLMYETIRIVEKLKPKFVIWENVKNLLSVKHRHNFDAYLEIMENLGYENHYQVLNAKDYGIPQNRNRVYTISILGTKKFNFDNLVRKEAKHISEFLEETREEKYIVTQPSMLKKIPCSNTFQKNNYGSLKVIEDSCSTITTKQMRCPNAGIIKLEDNRYRYLTERECWRLMGFEDVDYENVLREHKGIKGKLNGTLYKQAGNSIVVQVLEAIFRELLGVDVNDSHRTI